MEELYLYMQENPEVSMYLPESFEWIILSSGLIDGNRILKILENTEDYADSSEFFSWEQYYTKLLINETRDSYLRYSKSKLNDNYLHDKEKEKLIGALKVIETIIDVH